MGPYLLEEVVEGGDRTSRDFVDLLEPRADEADDAVIDRVRLETDRRLLQNGLYVLIPLSEGFPPPFCVR